MSFIGDLLRLSRSQTAAVEGAGVPLAMYLGGAPLWTIPLWVVLGVFIHWAGFAANGISDLKRDREDVHKFGHPLVAGRITERQAWVWVLSLEAIVLASFGYVTWLRGTWWSWLPMLWFVSAGYLYNYTAKAHKSAGVFFIASSFAALFYAYATLWDGSHTSVILAITLFSFWYVAWQIAIGGDWKDLDVGKENNLLRSLGSVLTRDGQFLPSPATRWYARILAVARGVTLGVLAWTVGQSTGFPWLWTIVIGAVATVSQVAYNERLIRPGPYDHAKNMRVLGLGEAACYLLMILALMPALWPLLWVAWVTLPVVWFVTNNRLLWSTGSGWAPGV